MDDREVLRRLAIRDKSLLEGSLSKSAIEFAN